MHKRGRQLADRFELPQATWRSEDWEDLHVSFETYDQHWDSRPLLRGLPNDECQCPHWGYVLKGSFRAFFGGREEQIRAGEAYYLPPGHTIVMEGGTELIEWSPRQQFQEHMSAVEELQRRNGTPR